MSSTTSSAATSSATGDGDSSGNHSSGPTSSPLLFFVALGFGVVFTNLWIIVGVKYCFRYNQRNRAARLLGENGEPIDLSQMPHHRRRRREKKLMSMEEVNERFPLTKYKIWRSSREAEGLPAAGGVTAPPSRAASVKDEEVNIDDANTTGPKDSIDSAHRPATALSIARQDHANAISEARPQSATAGGPSGGEKVPIVSKDRKEATETIMANRSDSVATDADNKDEDEDDDDPIRTATIPEMSAQPGDTCAICLETLDDDDDVRGLDCGHAFHGSCVDPWLTSRRACCPLCKADYYVPKTRPEGEEQSIYGGHRGRHANVPQQPQVAWLGGRGTALRARMMIPPSYFFYTRSNNNSRENHEQFRSTPRRQRTAGQEQGAPLPDPENQDQQTSHRNWRSRLPSLPQLGRRSQPQQQQNIQQHGHVEETEVTASELEAGTRQQRQMND